MADHSADPDWVDCRDLRQPQAAAGERGRAGGLNDNSWRPRLRVVQPGGTLANAATLAELEAEAEARRAAEAQAAALAAAEARARAEAEAAAEAESAAAEAARRVRAELRQRQKGDGRTRTEADPKALSHAEEAALRLDRERAIKEAEQQAREEAEALARAEAEAMRIAEERARQKAGARAAKKAEAEARRAAREQARREAEEQARKEAEERARAEAEARRLAEERARAEAEEQARKEAEERARAEAEALRLARERARREAEAQARKEAERAAAAAAKIAAREEARARREAESAAARAAAQMAGAKAAGAKAADAKAADAKAADAKAGGAKAGGAKAGGAKAAAAPGDEPAPAPGIPAPSDPQIPPPPAPDIVPDPAPAPAPSAPPEVPADPQRKDPPLPEVEPPLPPQPDPAPEPAPEPVPAPPEIAPPGEPEELPPPDPAPQIVPERQAPPADLAQHLRRLIASHGPISLAQFMGESNARYYASRDPLGEGGDFVTAPEISQMFGELIGLWFADLWVRMGSRKHIHYVELGPGRGTLARDALTAAARYDFAPQVHFVETSDTLRRLQREAFPGCHHHHDLSTLPDDAPLLIVANEFFDALPVHQLVRSADGWFARHIGLDGDRFGFVAGRERMDHLVPPSWVKAAQGAMIETSPAAAALMAEIARRLTEQGGAALVIDYGHMELRSGSTLQALKSHKKVDPLAHPGAADLTAHVDFELLQQIAADHGADVMGLQYQGEWLRQMGIDTRTEALQRRNPSEKAKIQRQRDRLVEDRHMGTLFKVLGLCGRRWPFGVGFE